MAELCNPLRCRLCFQKQFQLLPVFPANEPVNDDLLRKIQECASVSIVYEHDQTSMICIKCIVDVEQFYSFKERCMKNDMLLQQMRHDWDDKPVEEDDREGAQTPDAEFIEPVTDLGCPQDSTLPPGAFIGPSKLVRIGYNYRVVRVNDETDVLIYHKHRFYRPDKSSDCNTWVCVSKGASDCPAKLTVASSVGFPLALFTRPLKHNHTPDTVSTIGVPMEQSHEEDIVKDLPKYKLAVDGRQRLRLLAGKYRYKLQQSLFAAGMSMWSCIRTECPVQIMLSYEDEEALLEGDKTHCHDAEETGVGSSTASFNGALMAQEKPTTSPEHGYNYLTLDGCLIHRGYTFVRRNTRHCNGDATVLWHCAANACTVKVKVHRRFATMTSHQHNHPREGILPGREQLGKTLQQGVNYRLVSEGSGHIRLVHRKQKYIFQSVLPNGTSKWVCAWKRLGCKSDLKMLPDEQIVYDSTDSTVRHEHRNGNALERYFPQAELGGSGTETRLWTSPTFELLWNRNSKPIVQRQNCRYYARKAFPNGKLEWHCIRGIGTRCEATFTIDKSGAIVEENSLHDHQQARTRTKQGDTPSAQDIINSPGPVRLLAGGFNYRRMQNDHLNVEIIMHLAHKYLPDGTEPNTYRCILRDEPNNCPGKMILTNSGLCAETTSTHNHLARMVPKIAEPDRSSQVIVEGPNYELIYSMTGRNCMLLCDGNVYRMYKLLEPTQSSRWRCLHGEAGCKAYLSVPLSLTKPATADNNPHDHSRVRNGSRGVTVKEEFIGPEDGMVGARRDVPEEKTLNGMLRLRTRGNAHREKLAIADLNVAALVHPTTSDYRQMDNPLGSLLAVKEEYLEPMDEGAMENDATASLRLRSLAVPKRDTVIKPDPDGMSCSENESSAALRIRTLAIPKRETLIKPDPDGMTCFLNGHLYVRQFENLDTIDAPEWICAFRWTLGCKTRLNDLLNHEHERFASVRTTDRFSMLKTLISRGFIGQRGVMTLLPEGHTVSTYELLPSNENLSLIIDENRYYFYKAKNNGEWLWRCVRHRWQGCKIGVAVSHCFGKYYYQPYGKTTHEHS